MLSLLNCAIIESKLYDVNNNKVIALHSR